MVSASPKPHFAVRETPFKKALQERVDAHFAGRSRHATPALWAKAAFWLGTTFALWGVLTFVAVPGWLRAVLSLLVGFSIAQVGFNVGHDAIHGALSANAKVNAVFARSFDVMGASSRMWAWAHNVVHHTFTNVPGVDHDLEPGFFLHLYRRPTRGWLHRFQHVYAWPLYALTMVVWVFKKDFVQLREREQTTRADVVDVVAGKLLHFALWLGVPLLVGTHAWWQVLVGYALMLSATGFTAAVVFQLAHVLEGPGFPRADGAGELEGDFFTHQLQTTANFAPRSALATFFTGGLNHQVEHHLFPRVAHIHYPALSKLVEACAREHGVPYHVNASFLGAMASHARWLKQLGAPEHEGAALTALPQPVPQRG